MPKEKDYFKPLRKSATSLVGLSVATAVGSGVAAKAPAGTPSLTGGFSTLAGLAPIGVTVVGGKAAIGALKGLRRKRK